MSRSINSFSVSTNDDSSPGEAPVAPIKWTNWVTLAMYVVNVGITYASISGVFGATNTDLSKKYQTLITPAGWAFSIWGPIFIWEGIFASIQLLPNFRSCDSVQSIAPWWWASCVFQVLWSITFAAEAITLSFLLMICILVSLMGSLWTGDSKPGTVAEYWLVRGPLSLQCGWIVAASALNISVFADATRASQGMLLTLAIVSLGVVVSIAALAAVAIPLPNPIICFVAFWALMGIHSELGEAKQLQDPNRFNYSSWPQVVLDGVRGASLVLAFLSLGLMVVAAVLRSTNLLTSTNKGAEDKVAKDVAGSREAPLVGA